MKPHGRDCPLKCSMCRGATPRIVTQQGSTLLIDGVPAERDIEIEPWSPGAQKSRERFGADGKKPTP